MSNCNYFLLVDSLRDTALDSLECLLVGSAFDKRGKRESSYALIKHPLKLIISLDKPC